MPSTAIWGGVSGKEGGHREIYLTQRVFEVVLQKSIPTQIRQPGLSISEGKG